MPKENTNLNKTGTTEQKNNPKKKVEAKKEGRKNRAKCNEHESERTA